jgi:predicted aspartyl protease
MDEGHMRAALILLALMVVTSTNALSQDYQAKAVSYFTGECRFQLPRFDLPRYDWNNVDENGFPVDQWATQRGEQQPCHRDVVLGELFNGRFFVTFSNDEYIVSLWGTRERKPNPEDYYLSINTLSVLQPKSYHSGQWTGVIGDHGQGECHVLSTKTANRFIRCKINNRLGLTWNFSLEEIESLNRTTFPSVGSSSAKSIVVPLQKNESGTYVVPARINNAITLKFILDSGASDVSVPADVVMTLMRTGTLKSADFLGAQTYKLADGSTVPATTFRIASLTLGSELVENILGSVAPVNGPLILGQSILGRFRSWSIDNVMHALVLGPRRPEPDTSKKFVETAGIDVQDDKVLQILNLGAFLFVCPLWVKLDEPRSERCEPMQ